MLWFVVAMVMSQGSAAPGCQWTDWTAPTLGVSVRMQKCEGSGAQELREAGWRIGMYKAGAPEGALGKAVIEVYEKGDRQRITEAIERKALADVTARQKAGCEVVLVQEMSSAERQVYQIVPNALYKAEAQRQRDSEPGAEVCGTFGIQDSLQYFEYHPEVTRKRFLFVRARLGKGVIDPASIVLSKPAK